MGQASKRGGPGQAFWGLSNHDRTGGAARIARTRFDRQAGGSGTYVRSAKSSGLTFGLLIPNPGQTDIFEPMCQGMADASQGGRHALFWGYAEETPSGNEQAWRLCQQYIERGVSGVFFAPLEFAAEDGQANRRVAVALDKARIPLVLLDRCYLPYPHRSRYDLVGMTAMGVMLDRLARPTMPTRGVLLPAKLVVRDSCGASKVQASTAEEPMADPLAI